MRLAQQLFLFSGLTVTALTTAILYLVAGRWDQVALDQAEKGLARTATAIELLAESRFEQRYTGLASWAESGALLRNLDADSDSGNQLYAPPLHDFVLLLSADGEIVKALSEARPHLDSDLASAQPVPAAAKGRAGHGLWVVDGRFYEITAVPFSSPWRRATTGGVVLAGDALGDVVNQIRAVSGAEVVLLGGAEVVESTLPDALTRQVSASLDTLGAGRILALAGERYLVGFHETRADLGAGVCRHLILQPVTTVLGTSHKVFREVVALGLGAWLIVCGLAAAGSRRIIRPLARLTDSLASMAEEGAVDPAFPTSAGSVEVQALEATFRRLAQRLETANLQREGSYREAIAALVAALDERDHETHGHSIRVAAYASLLARQIGLPVDRVEALEWGALLHDIGKIGIPDSILCKPGPLGVCAAETVAGVGRMCHADKLQAVSTGPELSVASVASGLAS